MRSPLQVLMLSRRSTLPAVAAMTKRNSIRCLDSLRSGIILAQILISFLFLSNEFTEPCSPHYPRMR